MRSSLRLLAACKLALPFLALPFAVLLATAVGCDDPYADEKPVFKITGTVNVDGKPLEGIQIALHDVAGPDNAKPTYPQGFTQADGKVLISTYSEGDGAPPGEYKVTFVHQEYNVMARSYSGPDKFNKKYADAKSTPFTLKVGKGEKNDLGTVELTTKK